MRARVGIRWVTPLLFFAALQVASLVQASLVDDIIDAIVNAVDCGSCHALLVPLKGLAILGDSAFTSTLIAVCKALNSVDDDVCEGAVGQEAPIIAHSLRNISPFEQTSTKLCAAILGLCQPPEVNAFTFPLPAAPTNPKVFSSTGKPPIQVAHFSDVHIDREYTPGSEVNCTKPICCRNFADQAGKPVGMAARAIGEHHCDTSTLLAESMLRDIALRDTAFSIFTGDVINGMVWLVEQDRVMTDLNIFSLEMQVLMDSPVFPVIGNHEAAPVNSFPRNTTSDASSQWVYDTQAAGWSKWLDGTARDSVQHMSGSYAIVAPGTNLRIISLNTNYFYKANFWLYDSDTFQPDPNGILGFAAQQLQIAEDAGQRAWIIAHMSPGHGDALYDQSNYFDQIVQRYKNTIAGQFYGHSHNDEFAISYSDYSRRTAETAVSMMWMGPSLTPRSGNPAFKVYDVDPDTYEVMDAKVYFSDLMDPSFQTDPQWKLYYSAREVYMMAIPEGWPINAPLNATFWHKVTEAFERDDSPLFDKYLEFKSRGFAVEVCEPGECKDRAICKLRGGRAQDGCYVTTPGLNLRRREAGEHGTVVDECEGTNIGMVLSQMVSAGRDSGVDTAEVKARVYGVNVNK